jgi:3-hydroxyacyl-[acyl-carrier-protein] dehydratase
MRFILIDRVDELEPGVRARGVKCVSLTEEYLAEHFPGYAVLPGVLLLEGMAQLGGFLAECSAIHRTRTESGASNRASAPQPAVDLTVKRAILAQVEKAKFEKMVVPGDRVEYVVSLVQSMESAARVLAEATVGAEPVARATLTFAMREVPIESLHRERRALYAQWVRALSPVPELP